MTTSTSRHSSRREAPIDCCKSLSVVPSIAKQPSANDGCDQHEQLEDVFKNVESNTKFLVDASAANERASASLEIMQVILAGSLRLTLSTLVGEYAQHYGSTG